ncbi:head decoration protein [Desulforhopalus singaporensis]|uniref:Bacteriophage lambda head decoration protein D n=1 Tax=Desulforhopalus singaporensis TaxID=91360 RepID=A0A1H0VI52_9BACT|nr:head decoration protein [Desulforhopalus singaporensis]SDP77032.1 Bacteriophage lambda head decoration protein D [Desulforhopalus singaporensis]SDP78130.1 Bacteriophage lambda head decoration protein D [Desulforhopalus singaporensis]
MDLGMSIQTPTTENLLGAHPPVEIPIVLVSGENLSRGHVLGKITASGKYAGYDADLTDGCETAVAILAADTDASDGDENTIAYVHGEFQDGGLSWDDEANDKTSGLADLYAAGIFVK